MRKLQKNQMMNMRGQSSLIEQLTTKIHNNNLSNFERKKGNCTIAGHYSGL